MFSTPAMQCYSAAACLIPSRSQGARAALSVLSRLNKNSKRGSKYNSVVCLTEQGLPG